MLANSILLLCVFILISTSMMANATKIKIDLNYGTDKKGATPVTVSNSHTGTIVKGQGNTATNKVSMETLPHVTKAVKEPSFRKKGEIKTDSFTKPRELSQRRTMKDKKLQRK